MNIEQVKQKLMSAYKINKRIIVNRRKIKTLRDSITSISAPPFDKEPNCVHNNSSAIENAVAKISELEGNTRRLFELLLTEKEEILNIIDFLADENEQQVLILRYLHFDVVTGKMMPWESYADSESGKYVIGICEEMNYSKQSVFRFHNLALTHLSVMKIDKMRVNEI